MTPLQNLPICSELLRILAQQGVLFAEAVPAYLARLMQDENQLVLTQAQIQQLDKVLKAIALDIESEVNDESMVFGVLDESLKSSKDSDKIDVLDLLDLLGGKHDTK